MFSRRNVITGSILSSVMTAPPASAAQRPATIQEIREALADLRRVTPLPELVLIRERQRIHLKVNGKLPDYVDVGVQVWEHLYDWHIENRRPLTVARRTDGRVEMLVQMTAAVLHHDIGDAQIGIPYDR